MRKLLILAALLLATPVIAQEQPPAIEQLAVNDNWTVSRDNVNGLCKLFTVNQGATVGIVGSALKSSLYLMRENWNMPVGKTTEITLSRMFNSSTIPVQNVLTMLALDPRMLIGTEPADAVTLFIPQTIALIEMQVTFKGTERPWKFNMVAGNELVLAYNNCINSLMNNQTAGDPFGDDQTVVEPPLPKAGDIATQSMGEGNHGFTPLDMKEIERKAALTSAGIGSQIVGAN